MERDRRVVQQLEIERTRNETSESVSIEQVLDLFLNRAGQLPAATTQQEQSSDE
jgi:hypothetical protein